MKLLYFGLFLTILTLALTLIIALGYVVRKKRSLPQFLFVGLIFSVSLGTALVSLRQADLLSSTSWLLYLGFPLALLFGPFFFLYIRSIINLQFKLRRKDWIHFIPFLLGWIWTAVVGKVSFEILELGHPISFERYLRVVLFVAIGSIYFVATFNEIKKYRSILKNIVSSSQELILSWFNYLLAVFLVFLVLGYFEILTGSNFTLFPLFSPVVCFTLVCLSIFGLGESSVLKLEGLDPGKRHLDNLLLEQGRKNLLQYFEKDKPYLNPSLRLNDLAEPLGLKSYEVSEVINETFGMNFFDLVNSFRVEEVKRKIDQERDKYTKILTIAFESGFNTKSSFNSAFKKFSGFTPSEYRKKIISSTGSTL